MIGRVRSFAGFVLASAHGVDVDGYLPCQSGAVTWRTGLVRSVRRVHRRRSV